MEVNTTKLVTQTYYCNGDTLAIPVSTDNQSIK